MAEKTQYKTRQREELLTCLREKPGRHFTAAELCACFREKGRTISAATVYRQLERMVDDGLVNKYFIDENSGACFAYIDPAEHWGGGVCYHCRCECCGKLIHMECHEIEALQSHLLAEHGFSVDPRRTVFYGLCADCREAEA